MRNEYGKLVYLLQDSAIAEVQELLEFECVRPIKTVFELLREKDNIRMLHDPLVEVATREIIPEGKTRYDINREIRDKERAVEILSQRYRTAQLSSEEIQLCLYSIGDNHSFLRGNRDPVDKMIGYLRNYFRPDQFEEGFSLAISMGRNGARLTHNHTRQYHYVLQSMTLWREILHDMFKLWYLSESDLLASGNGYRLVDTGQVCLPFVSCSFYQSYLLIIVLFAIVDE